LLPGFTASLCLGGFTDIRTGEVLDVDTMLTLFTADDLTQVRLTSVLVRPLPQQSRRRSDKSRIG
jgi:hypothetical protein